MKNYFNGNFPLMPMAPKNMQGCLGEQLKNVAATSLALAMPRIVSRPEG